MLLPFVTVPVAREAAREAEESKLAALLGPRLPRERGGGEAQGAEEDELARNHLMIVEIVSCLLKDNYSLPFKAFITDHNVVEACFALFPRASRQLQLSLLRMMRGFIALRVSGAPHLPA